ncbi:MAG: hypothetical protein QOE11_3055 [Solirubrobacteraceae bacterium]|nr:hypothetical protein [Solirubrobacteraceae bacterium]
MVITMLVLTVTLLVAGIAISDTVTARKFTDTDRRADAAQQAADAGLQIAMYRANQMNIGKSDFNSGLTGLVNSISCLVPGVDASGYVSTFTTVTLALQTACPTKPPVAGGPVTPPPAWNYFALGNRTSYAYQFLPGASPTLTPTTGHASLNPIIVAIGREDNGTPSDTSDDVVRRVEGILNPIDPFEMIEATGDLTFSAALATTLNGDVRTNGDLKITGLLGGTLAGVSLLSPFLRPANVQYGGTKTGALTVASVIKNTTPFTRAPVTISPSKANCPVACPAAAYYDSSSDRLTLTSGQSLTLAGGDYVFCNVSVASGATLNTSLTATAPTRIFIDSPNSARCSSGGGGNLSLLGNLNTVNVTPSQLQIYMAGNGAAGASTATINTKLLSGTPAFFLYAPNTDVTMTFLLFQGNVIGRNVVMNASCTLNVLGVCLLGTDVISQDLGLYNLPLSSAVGVFSRKQYIQCAGDEPVATNPTKDC